MSLDQGDGGLQHQLQEDGQVPEKEVDEEDDGDEESADEDCLIQPKQLIFNPTSQLNKWLKSRGK